MPNEKHPFLNFQVDHMTMHVVPEMYNAVYVLFRTLFGVSKKDVIYEKRKEWEVGQGDESMTFAVKIGQGLIDNNHSLHNTIIALVQPSEPKSMPSHSRELLKRHNADVHWQHIALRTTDLLAFHKYVLERGVNFITPIMKDEDEDVIQVFSGEWYMPGSNPSGVFFEFTQRNPTPELLKKLEEHNRESWFRDKTFLGLYSEKEKESQTKNVTPFIDHELFLEIQNQVKDKKLWEITEEAISKAELMMMDYSRFRVSSKPSQKV